MSRAYLYARWLIAPIANAFDARFCAWADPALHPSVLHRLQHGLPRLPGDPKMP